MPASRDDYIRGARFSIAAIPFMTMALWGLSRFTTDPMSIRSALGAAVGLAFGMILTMWKLGRMTDNDNDRRTDR